MIISKNIDGSFLVINETKVNINMETLKLKINEIKEFNNGIKKLEEARAQLPENLQQYVMIPGEIPIDDLDLELLAEMEKLNG